jgi:hypothetical protein
MLNLSWNHNKLFQALASQVALIHLRQALKETQIIIRFENGYGVTVLPISIEGNDEVFEMLVLRFYGEGINDYRVAQYAAIPELNRGNFEEIIHLCRQVSFFPKIQPMIVSSGPKATI